MDLVLSLFFFALAVACSGGMDTIVHHFPSSIFMKIKDGKVRRWFFSYWKDHYEGNDLRRIKRWFWVVPLPPMFWDGWHCFKSFQIVFIVISILLLDVNSLTLLSGFGYFLMYLIVWGLSFEFAYAGYFTQKHSLN